MIVALACLVALVPMYQIRFPVFGIPTTMLEWCIGVLFLAFLLHVLINKQKVVIPYAWLFLSFVGAGILATATSVDVRAGLGLFKAYIVEPVLVYILAVHYIRTQKHQRWIQYAFIVLVIAVASIAVLQAAHVINVPEPYASEHPRRVTSVYPFPTAIGKLFAPILAFFAAYLYVFIFLLKKNYSKILLYAAPVVLGFLSLVFSVNRGAMLGVIAAIAFVMLAAKHWKACVVAVMCVALMVVSVPQLRSYVMKVFERQDTSTDVRVVMWKGTIRLIEAHPLFGAGLGGFPKLYDVYRDASHVELFPNPDQLVLTVWSEMGVAGMIVFTLIFIAWVRVCIRLFRSNERGSNEWMLGIAGLAALIALFVHGMVDTPYFKNDLAVVFWALFGLLVAVQRQQQEKNIE